MKKQPPSVPTRSESYWKEDAVSFTSLYEEAHGASLFNRIVAGFLTSRTDKLLSMIGTREYKTAVDVGCGSGIHLRLLSSQFHYMYGVDYSRQMLDIAGRLLADVPKTSYKLILADAAHIPLADGVASIVIAMGLLDYVPDPPAVLRECRRILAPEGTMVVSLPRSPSFFGFLRSRPGNFIKKHLFHLPPIDNAMTREQVERMFLDTGLKITDVGHIWTTMWMVKAIPLPLKRTRNSRKKRG